MAVFKCKMCGGDLQVEAGKTTGVCEFCGTQQTLPRLSDDRRVQMYDRASHFRRNNDYDKAAGIYEAILNEDNTDAEAYWSLVLCKYGVEYVEDPKTKKRIPTCNRTQLTSIFADEDYKQALAYGDAHQRMIYEDEAKAIDKIQKGILEISNREEPFDVFICYKETDEYGKRTRDSVIAQELYHELTKEGFKVFFARITLESVLGTAYEPYIFSALNSAKVMVVLGTRRENFNAVWVKNEWSRYLGLIKGGAKKVLIPAYRDMDPYDLPEEFSHLQALDMSKLGFMQDLVRGIKKNIGEDSPKASKEEKQTIVFGTDTSANADALLKRAFLFLEDRDFPQAQTYFNRVLDLEPENAEAYVGLLCIEQRVCYPEALQDCESPFSNSNHYKKAIRFGASQIEEYNQKIIDRLALEKKAGEYNRYLERYKELKKSSNTESSSTLNKAEELKLLAASFKNLDYQDSTSLSESCLEMAREFETVANRLLEQEMAIKAEQDRLRAIEIQKEKIKRRKIITFSSLVCAVIIGVLYICGAISRIPPSSGAVKEYLLNRLDGVFAEGEAKITSLEKKDDQWYFTFTKSSEKDELEGSGKVTVDFEAKNIVFGKYDLYAEYKVDLMKVKQGISEQEVMNSLYEYSQLEYDVVITPSETIQDNMTSAYVKGTGKGDNFVINIDSELQFVYESDYTYTERKWVCTNLDILSVTRTPITAIDDQSVITALQELLVAEGINGLIVSADERQKLKITDITIEQPQYDETFQNASLQVSHITITHPQYTSTGRASLDMYLSDGQWAISGSGFALETAANAPDKDELLLLMEGKEVNTEFGTLNFDKSKVSDVKDIEFIGDGSSYTVSFTADYHSDLFKTTGVFTVTLHWDITGDYRFIKASFIKDSIVLTNKSAFNSTFSSNYSAIEEYGIGTSGNISITFTDYSESNSLVSANVKIAGRTLSMTGTMNPFNCEVSSLHTNQTFNATVEVPMYIFSGLTTTAEFRNIVVSLSGLNFNWDEIKCSGTINIKHDAVIGYSSEGSAWF